MTLKVVKAKSQLHDLSPLQLTVSATTYAFLQQLQEVNTVRKKDTDIFFNHYSLEFYYKNNIYMNKCEYIHVN